MSLERAPSSPLKWPGAKKWLVPKLRELFAAHRHRHHRLVELFVGGMNVALGVRPEEALLCDKNPHLINFFERLKNPKPFSIEMRNSEHLYYRYRDCFNEIVSMRFGAISSETAAELFYYLNRTGFNGLCRFNADGRFNVPFGKYKSVNYRSDFSEYSNILRAWTLWYGDFESVKLEVEDFVYADPPYDGTFTDYSKGGFSWADQLRLVTRLVSHPGPVVASNAATDRILTLYRDAGFGVEVVSAPRSIAANGDRAPAAEMLATRNI